MSTTPSVQLQVAIELPLSDLLVRKLPLAALAPNVVVGVVLVHRAPERGADDVVGLELARRVEQVARQDLDAELLAARLVGLVEVEPGVGLARIQLALDPVQARAEQ